VRAGENVGIGTDHTLFALVNGQVAFKRKGPDQRMYVSVNKAAAEPSQA